MILVLTGLRLGFALYFSDLKTLLASPVDLRKALVLGLRFDLIPLAYINGLPFILINLAYFIPGKWAIRVVRPLVISLLTFGYLALGWIYLFDYSFYTYFQDHLKMQSGVFIVNIPYRGTAPAVQDVLAGQVDLMFANIGNVQAHLKAGKLKALGVTSPKRLASLPEVPAIAELLPGYESSAWFGLFGPGRMAPELTRRLSDAARQAVASPEVSKRIAHEGATPVGNSPQEFAAFVNSEITRWAKVVKSIGLQVQ